MPTDLAMARLLQLVSPALPVGAFAWSQGLEWAVEAGWVEDADSLERWLDSQARLAVVVTDLPLLRDLHGAVCDPARFFALDAEWLAWRDSEELRAEERQKGRALATLLRALEPGAAAALPAGREPSYLAAFAWAAARWGIDAAGSAGGYLYSWLENQVIAAVKLVPLGQTDGQRVLHRLAACIPAWVAEGLALAPGEHGGGVPLLSLASARHETQYTRLYRS